MIVYINDTDSIDLGLIPLSADIPSPNPRLYYVDVPGRNGKLDVTEYMGDVTYENITITVTFESFLKVAQVRDILRQFNGLSIALKIENKETIEVYTGRMNAYTAKTNGSTTSASLTIDASPEVEYVDN